MPYNENQKNPIGAFHLATNLHASIKPPNDFKSVYNSQRGAAGRFGTL
jgi:hypothetical protein